MKVCAVTIRRLKPGAYDDFRRAWEPEPWPAQLDRVVVSRNEQDPDQVLTASFFELPVTELDAARNDPDVLGAEDRRLRRIADYEESVVFKGIFQVVDDLTGPAAPAA
jgi:hypothetical protein